MNLNRRQFLLLTTGVAALSCPSVEADTHSAVPGKIINAGPMSDYAKDGVYSRFKDAGFFIVRKGDNLFAVSSYCTHRKCKLTAEADRTFYCSCHGSTFDPKGHVTKGPARVDLPVFSTSSNERGQLLVTVRQQAR